MTIQLTEKQIEALKRDGQSPVAVVDLLNNTLGYLIPASDYQTVQEILDDDRQQKALRAVGLRNAAARLRDEE